MITKKWTFPAGARAPRWAPGTGKTKTGRLWTYVRDERPHGGQRPAAAVFFASPDRRGERPRGHLAAFSGVLQADGCAGFNGLYESGRIVEAGPVATIVERPGDPYTIELLAAAERTALPADAGRYHP